MRSVRTTRIRSMLFAKRPSGSIAVQPKSEDIREPVVMPGDTFPTDDLMGFKLCHVHLWIEIAAETELDFATDPILD